MRSETTTSRSHPEQEQPPMAANTSRRRLLPSIARVGLTALCILLMPSGLSLLGANTRPRLVLIKIDGLSPLVLDAAIDPEGLATDSLPRPESFRSAHSTLRSLLGRDTLLPNFESYFYTQGVRVETYSGTLPLSTPAWAMIDTGQSSIVKNNVSFSRFTGDLTYYLDQMRESLGTMVRAAGRTTALWQLDLLGMPIAPDFFPEGRVWTSIQPFYRHRPSDQLVDLAKHVVTAGEKTGNPLRWLKRHLADTVYGPDYPEEHDEAIAALAARKIEEVGEGEAVEKYDFISFILVAIDHQFHVDPDYSNILSWLARIDSWLGEVLAAVEQSKRREDTIVALLSDHGLDFEPVLTNYSFPINRWLRDPRFGGHTVLAPIVEDKEHALTVPVSGVDFARIYESPSSPYGASVPFGEAGYPTAFTANSGNPRFDGYLRNSDLNRLHLLMLEVLRCRGERRRLDRIYPEFQKAFEAVRSWLDHEIIRAEEAADGLERCAAADPDPETPEGKDAVRRLRSEGSGYRRVVETLKRLRSIPCNRDEWIVWAQGRFKIRDLVPKQYWGPPNTIEQLRHYVVGWEVDTEARWKSGVPSFRTIDYTSLFPAFKTPSPNASGNPHPFHFFSAALASESVQALVDRPLKQAIWLVFAPGKGEAVVLESMDGDLMYQPLDGYDSSNGKVSIALREGTGPDPLGYSHLAGRWMSPRQWARHTTGDHEWQLVPVILADLFRDNLSEYVPVRRGAATDAPESVRFHFRQQVPDFRVWTHRGWNVNSNSHTPGGSHGNFTALDTKTLFSVWGGANYPLARGEPVKGPFFTYEVLPTLLSVLSLAGEPGVPTVPDQIRWRGEIAPILKDERPHPAND